MRATAAGSALVLVVLAIFLVRPAPLADLDSKVCDLLSKWAGPGQQSGHAVIVEIDERSLTQFGRWPWPRDLIGHLSDALLDAGAAAVAFDMMFPQEDGANDAILAKAIAGKPVVVGYALKFDGGGAGSPNCSMQPLPLVVSGLSGGEALELFHATGVVCSAPAISAPGSGFLNAAPDHDGAMRHVPMVVEYANRYYPSLALAAVNSYRRAAAVQLAVVPFGAWRLRLDGRVISLEERTALRLRFRGAKRRLPYISAADVLGGGASKSALQNSIAVVGGSAPGIEAPVVTPVDRLFPAVEIQATAIDNLLAGDSFYRPDGARLWELALALLAGSLSTLLLVRMNLLSGALATLVLVVGVWAGCAWALSTSGMLFSPLPATAAQACALPALTFLHYLQEKKRADLSQQRLAQTEQRSREVLEESELRYRRLVENINDAIIMDDVQGRLVFANRRFREWFGTEGDAASVVLEDYVAPEWRGELRNRHDRRMRGESVPDHFEFEGIRSDGTRIWIEALVTAVEDEGRVIGSQAALRDITERKRMEAQYLQAQKMEGIGRLAGGVAHDFNNLLTVINGYSGMLLARDELEHPIRRELEEIHKAGERAADLTRKLLTFSRKDIVQPGPLNLNVVVADAKKMFEHLIGEDIELITLLSADLEAVIADAGQIHQVLMNLVVNARDAMPNGGRVTIETKNVAKEAGSCVYLGVSDTGTGLTDEVRQHLFEPFFTTKDQGKGTGLGLATVYGIVQQSGGTIDVSSALGEGTTFHICLPGIRNKVAEQLKASSDAEALRGSETVLLVEDQDSVREFCRVVLESFGYHVLQASNGRDAIALAEQHPAAIDLLVTDVILPIMDGRVLVEKLRAVHPETKVLYMSGYSEETIERGRPLGSDLALLPKPFTAEALGTRVREILNGSARPPAASSEGTGR
jgi:PAS domain S-box-containing protein